MVYISTTLTKTIKVEKLNSLPILGFQLPELKQTQLHTTRPEDVLTKTLSEKMYFAFAHWSAAGASCSFWKVFWVVIKNWDWSVKDKHVTSWISVCLFCPSYCACSRCIDMEEYKAGCECMLEFGLNWFLSCCSACRNVGLWFCPGQVLVSITLTEKWSIFTSCSWALLLCCWMYWLCVY